MLLNQIKIEKSKAMLIIFITFLICVIAVALVVISIMEKETYATSILNEIEVTSSLQSNIDIMDILKENTSKQYKEEYLVEEKDLEYITIYEDNANLPKGMVQVLQEGRDGVQEVTTKKVYENEELISEEEISSKIIKAYINKVVQVGTGAYKSNYKVRVGDKLYVTSDTLGVMVEPSREAQKILTIHKDYEVELLEIQKEWYKISYGIYTGYCPANCLTYLKPNSLLQQNEGTEGTLDKNVLISKLSFNMKLNEPSGLTLEQFKKVLSRKFSR